MTPRTCERVKDNGEPCKANARPGRPFCAFHDPELSGRRAAGRRAGGVKRAQRAAVLPEAPEVRLGSVAELGALLDQTMSQVRRGELDPRVGNCIGYLASVRRQTLVDGELELRLAALEQRLKGKHGKQSSAA
jgi:hypothetical protein